MAAEPAALTVGSEIVCGGVIAVECQPVISSKATTGSIVRENECARLGGNEHPGPCWFHGRASFRPTICVQDEMRDRPFRGFSVEVLVVLFSVGPCALDHDLAVVG
jgi:hypothetical protein